MGPPSGFSTAAMQLKVLFRFVTVWGLQGCRQLSQKGSELKGLTDVKMQVQVLETCGGASLARPQIMDII